MGSHQYKNPQSIVISLDIWFQVHFRPMSALYYEKHDLFGEIFDWINYTGGRYAR